jgi:hypothetical protein
MGTIPMINVDTQPLLAENVSLQLLLFLLAFLKSNILIDLTNFIFL